MVLRSAALAAAALTLAGCAGAARVQTAEPAAFPGFEMLTGPDAVQAARARLQVLAADSMLGREATAEGERRASAYLADQLRRAGVLPGGDLATGTRSYFQRFPVSTSRFRPEGTSLNVKRVGELELGTDWLTFTTLTPEITRQDVEMVFAGYGITAPDGSYDDYAGLDAAGKVVVVVGGKPSGLDSLRYPFGTVNAGGVQAKIVAALQHGAAAILLAHDPFFAENWEPFAVQAQSLSVGPAGEEEQTSPAPLLVLSDDAADRLLAAMGVPADVAARAGNGDPLTPAATALTADLSIDVERAQTEARNVVGYVLGDEMPNEYVALGAHYDHHGVINGQVYNGADDDGSGTVAVLNVAEAFARDRAAGRATDRSLLFVFHTAEEKGLIGSDYFTTHPQQSILGDIENAVAQINLDMLGREHPDSLHVVGAYRLSEAYGALVDSVNQALEPGPEPLFHLGRSYDAPEDPEQIYERSDHFNYARFGVPIVFFFDGMGANWSKNTPTDDYHRPTDDVEKINFEKLVRAEQLVYGIGRAVADAPQRPALDPGVVLAPVEH